MDNKADVHICIYEKRWDDFIPKINTLITNSEVAKEKLLYLEKRINGSLDVIGKHLDEAPEYRTKTEILSNDMKIIKQERLNTQKAAQYRVALVAGAPGAILALLKIAEMFFK